MPLQWLNLQQRQRQQPRSVVSQALTPRPQPGQGVVGGVSTMPAGGGFMERVRKDEAIEAERKYNEKMMKMQHEQGMEKAKFAAGLKEDAAKGITAGQALGRAPTEQQVATKGIEANPEEASKITYEFLLSLPEETQKVLLKQIFAPTAPKSTMSAGGKTIPIGGEKLNAIAQSMLAKGQVTMDASGKPVLSKPVTEYEKGTFQLKPEGVFNTATGKLIPGTGDIPPDWGIVYTEVLAEGLKHIKEMMDASWMQTMDTDEMNKHIEAKKGEYRDWIASRLFSKGMTDKNEINKLADLAIGSYEWEKHLDEAKAREATPSPAEAPAETDRGLPLDEEVVAGLREIFKEFPEDLEMIEQYKDKFGELSVNKALEKETKIQPIPETKEIKKTFKTYTEGLKPLGKKKKPTEFKKWKAL